MKGHKERIDSWAWGSYRRESKVKRTIKILLDLELTLVSNLQVMVEYLQQLKTKEDAYVFILNYDSESLCYALIVACASLQ